MAKTSDGVITLRYSIPYERKMFFPSCTSRTAATIPGQYTPFSNILVAYSCLYISGCRRMVLRDPHNRASEILLQINGRARYIK